MRNLFTSAYALFIGLIIFIKGTLVFVGVHQTSDQLFENNTPNPLVLNFHFSPDSACAGSAVGFLPDPIVGGTAPFTYQWRFGDGATSSLMNPFHIYTAIGCGIAIFKDTLIVTDATGLADTVIHDVMVKKAPDVQIADQDIFSPFSNCDNSPSPANPNFTLTIANTSPGANCIQNMTIDWGDNTIETGLTSANFPRPHMYTQLGAFNLKVTAFGQNGCSNSKTYTVANQSTPAIGLGTFGPTEGCSPLDVSIVLSLWQSNSPGTIFALNYGDGVIDTFTYPIKTDFTSDTIVHRYTTTACPNAQHYQLSVLAINKCRVNPFYGALIQVKTKPQAKFSVFNNPACVGQSVCFKDSTTPGYYTDCSANSSYVWDFGDPASGAANSSNIKNPCHTYTVPGQYIVSQTTANPCGSSVFKDTVCITTLPVASFVLDTSEICNSHIVNVSNTSITGVCASPIYQWSVTYVPGFCETSGLWSFTNGTNQSSANPSFSFSKAGTYQIMLRILGPCPSAIFSQTVKVRRPPTIKLQPVGNVCGPIDVCPIATISNCGDSITSFFWQFDQGVLGTSANPNPGCIPFSTVGPHFIICTVSNSCGSTSDTLKFNINSPPQLVNFPSKDTFYFCPGQIAGPFIFTSLPVPPNANISWVNTNTSIGLGSGSAGSISGFTALNATNLPVTAKIIVTASSNNCLSKDSFFITVNPKPLPPVVTSPLSYCKGANAPSLATAAIVLPGHSLLWYTTATGGTGSPVAPTPLTNTLGTTLYYASQVNLATGCESIKSLIEVKIVAVPTITGSSIFNPDSCNAPRGVITLAGLTANTIYTINYNVNGQPHAPYTISSNAQGNIVISGLGAGTYENIIISSGLCSSNMVGPFALTNPDSPDPPMLTTNGPACVGGNLVINATGLPPMSVVAWTGPQGPLGSHSPNLTFSPASLGDSGQYTARINVAGCPSAPASINAIVNRNPATPAPFSNIPCSGGTLQLNVGSFLPNGTLAQWMGPGSFSSSDPNPSISNVTTAAIGPYSVFLISTLTGCVSQTATITATVKPSPVISGLTVVQPTGCALTNGDIIIHGLSAGLNYVVHYKKNNNADTSFNLASNVAGDLSIVGLGAATYSTIYVELNGCASNTAGPSVLEFNPPFHAVASGNSPLCDGNTLTLRASPSTSAQTLYEWRGPNGFMSNLQNPIINPATIINTGWYFLTIKINGCISTDSTFITISATPVGGHTYTDTTVCSGNNTGLIHIRNYYGHITGWESSTNNGSSWISISNTTDSLRYNNIISTTLFRAVIMNGACPPVYSDTTKVVLAPTVSGVVFYPSIVTTCSNDTTVTLRGIYNYAGSGILNFRWYDGITTIGNSDTLQYRVRTPVSYTQQTEHKIAFTVETKNYCIDSFIGKIIVQPRLQALIRVTPSLHQNEPQNTFGFEEVSSSNPDLEYTWYIGDKEHHISYGNKVSYSYAGPGSYTVKVRVRNRTTGCEAFDSVIVTIHSVPGWLYVPDAFYPNSINSSLKTFRLQGLGIEKYTLEIFDSYGNILFKTTELNADGSPKIAWDGLDSKTGKPMLQDVYGWRISCYFRNGHWWDGMSYKGEAPKRFGTLTLFR